MTTFEASALRLAGRIRRAVRPSPATDIAGVDRSPRAFGFLHVPKSAGSSVIASLRSGLSDHRWAPWEFDETLMGPYRGVPANPGLQERILPAPDALVGYEAAAGHFSLPTLQTAFEPADIVVLAREPRSRLLSHYQYWRSLSDRLHEEHLPWTSSLTAIELDFAAWLNDPSIAYQSDNLLVRQLVPNDPAIPADDFIAAKDLPRLARAANRALRRVGWVGLVELGDTTWNSLGERAGVELAWERLNTTERRRDRPTDLDRLFSADAVRSLAARTDGDRAVWLSIARRLRVNRPDVIADVAWSTRLGRAVRDEIDDSGTGDGG